MDYRQNVSRLSLTNWKQMDSRASEPVDLGQECGAASAYAGGSAPVRPLPKVCARKQSMNPDATSGPLWEEISTAPYDRDLELAVIERDRLHPLIFACRRTPGGWIKVATLERIVVHPTHWRLWPAGR